MVSLNLSSPDQVHNLLVVDDEEHILDSLSWTLSRSKQFECQVDTANSGSKGLELIGSKKYAVVLSDYKMPMMDGVEFLKRVREADPSIIRILITGYTDIKIAKEAINKARIDYYMEKPWDNEGLREIIKEALDDRQFREEMPLEPQAEQARPQSPPPQTSVTLNPGESYLFRGAQPDACFRLFANVVTTGREGLCISTQMPDSVRETYGLKTTPVLWLSKQNILSDKILHANNISHIVFAMKNYIRKSKQAIIMLEGLDYLITIHGFDKIAKLIQDMWEYIMLSKSNLLIPLNPQTMNPQELATLERYFKPINGGT